MQKAKMGAYQLVFDFLKVDLEEKVVLVTDNKNFKKIALPIEDQIKAVGGEVTMFILERFGKRPEIPEENAPSLVFPEQIKEALAVADACIYCAQCKSGEAETLLEPMIQIVKKRNIRYVYLGGNMTPRKMYQQLSVNREKLMAYSKRILDELKKSTKCWITSPLGTKLECEFQPETEWRVNECQVTPGVAAHFPLGDIFSIPSSINGVLISDHIGHPFNWVLDEDAVTLEIKDKSILKTGSKSTSIQKRFVNHLSKRGHGGTILSIAFETNNPLLMMRVVIGKANDNTSTEFIMNGNLEVMIDTPTVLAEGGVELISQGVPQIPFI